MEDWLTLFKANPVEAIVVVVGGAVGFLMKRKSEKAAEAESRGVDAREIERLNKEVERRDQIIANVAKERDEERDRADDAFAKQLELTERFSEMRASNERGIERMEQLSKQMAIVIEDNIALREQVKDVSTQLHEMTSKYTELGKKFEDLKRSINAGAN